MIEPNAHRYTYIFAEIVMTARDDFDPLAPQREAAFFYGLFLRGHSIEALRQDIDVSPVLLDKWLKARDFEESFREALQRFPERFFEILRFQPFIKQNRGDIDILPQRLD